jgi:L-fuculose-phosphate aldolase
MRISDMSEQELRESICEVGRRLYQAGLIRGSDGNLSIRLSNNEILITPSGTAKGFLNPDDLIVVNLNGELLRGERKPSLETHFHLAAYQERGDVQAVVHAHPPKTVAFTVAGREYPKHIMPEIDLLFPMGVPVAPYETPGTQKLADGLRPYFNEYDLVVLSHHGTVCLGHNIYEAWIKTEHLEACAEIYAIAETLGGLAPLPEGKLPELQALRQKVLASKAVDY